MTRGVNLNRNKYALDADLLREAIEDDGLSRSTLKIMARMTTLEPTPEIQRRL